jgi:hypothetical protein
MATAKEKVDEFLRALGLLVVEWNAAERWLTRLLRQTVLDSDSVDILTAHMTADAKTQALLVCAKELPAGDVKDRLIHACKFLDALREWRNLYVHNTGSSFHVGDDDAVGRTRQLKARHRFILRLEPVTRKELERIAEECRTFSNYAYRLESFMYWQAEGIADVHHSDGSEITLPEMPPLPPSLEASRASRRPR